MSVKYMFIVFLKVILCIDAEKNYFMQASFCLQTDLKLFTICSILFDNTVRYDKIKLQLFTYHILVNI